MFVPTNVDDDSRIKNSSCAKIQHCKTSKIDIFNRLELFLSMKGDSIFEVEKPADEEPKEDDDNAEYSGKIYERMDDEELCNAHR